MTSLLRLISAVPGIRCFSVFTVAILIFIHAALHFASAADMNLITFLAPIGPNTSAITKLDEKNTVANAANTAGTIVGYVDYNDGTRDAFAFADGAVYAFGYPNAQFTEANGITQDNVIVGSYRLSQGGIIHGYYFYNGTFHGVDCFGNNGTVVNGINSSYVMIGGYLSGSRNLGFYLWNGQCFSVNVPGSTNTVLTAITDDNVLLGYHTTGEGRTHGFYIVNGQINTFDVPNAQHTFPSGITDSYEIVGFYQDKSSGKWNSFTLLNGTFKPFGDNAPGFSNLLINGESNVGALVGQITGPDGHISAEKSGTAGWPAPPDTPKIPPALPGLYDWLYPSPNGQNNPATGEPLGQFHSANFSFRGDGTVQFQVAIVDKTYNGGVTTCNDSNVWDFSGNYAAYGQHLLLDVQGVRTTEDNCNPARNAQIPFGATHYDWDWLEGVARRGTLLDLHTGWGAPFNIMLLRKTG